MAHHSQRKALMFFIFTIFLAVFIAIWGLFLNNGSIVFKSSPPFTITIAGGESKVCNEEDCQINLAPGNYSVVLEKQGHYKIAKEITLQRWQQLQEEVKFVEIPFVEEIGSFLNTNSEALSTVLNTDFLNLQSIDFKPSFELENIKQITLSPNAKFYISEDADEDSALYSIDEQEIETNQTISNFAWTNNDILYFLDRDRSNGQFSLFKYNPFTDVKEVVTTFPRNNSEFKIFNSTDLDKLLVTETSEEESIWYLVDLKEKSKAEILTTTPVKTLNISPNFMYATATLIDDSRTLVDLKTKSVKKIQNGVTSNRETFLDQNNLLIFTSINDLSAANITEENLLEESLNGLLDVVGSTENLNFLYKYNISENSYEALLETEIDITNLQVFDKQIMFVDDQNNLYKIQAIKF